MSEVITQANPTGKLEVDFPTIINGVTYSPFGQWNITYYDVRTVHETEGGTQEDVIINTGRRSIAVATACLQPTATTLVGLNDLANFNVKFFDIKTAGYVESLMRVVAGSMVCNLRRNTSRLSSTYGVYDVSFTLEEYE